ncbi:hypothetical protein BS47DRAFT_636313 [Hydnum rufescens UP504]|uniref:Uncharacterized protein n=1 Tax=Hydnum rufescens UP504 TaxID=1448309 RepID=A0A9P6BA06_9AGAM|nr:hypothetical protein BS47DRAFT_636313 [Hydnum rufescens UP504]
MAHTTSSIPTNTSRGYSKPHGLGSDFGQTETAATPPPLGPDTPSSSPEHASPGIMTEFPTRPRPTRELSRNTLYPRTPATRHFSSQLQNTVIRRPPSPITPRAISLRSISSSSANGDLGMPGMKETDDPYKKIVVTDSEQDPRAMTPIANGSSHPRTSSYGLLQPGMRGKKRKKKKRPDTHTETSISEKRKSPEDGFVSSSAVLEKQPSTEPLKPFGRRYPAVSLTGLSPAERPPNATNYIPSHHGKAKSLRPGAEPLHTDDFTPTCMDGLKRSWQSFKLTLRFGAFRTRRRIKRRVGLT